MKLNNKGFAITAVLYGLLILFVILVSSYLLILSSRKNKLDAITKDIENSYFGIDSYSDDDSGGTTPSSSGETGGTTPSSSGETGGTTPSSQGGQEKYTVEIYYETDGGSEKNFSIDEVLSGNSLTKSNISSHEYGAKYVSSECDKNQNFICSASWNTSNYRDAVQITISNVTSNIKCVVHFES